MLTSKQKSYLKSLGNTLDSIVQIGKGGLSEAVVGGTRDALNARELIKVRVLPNSLSEPEDVIRELAEQTHSELVQVIGRNGLLYKRNQEKPRIELP